MLNKIEGLKSDVHEGPDGTGLARFHPEHKSDYRSIEVVFAPDHVAEIRLLEGTKVPRIDVGEEHFIPVNGWALSERIVRAMAVYHLGVDEAADANTKFDVALLSRGFGITFAPDGSPGWLRHDGSTAVVISKDDDGGLPSIGDDKAQAIIKSVVGGILTVRAPGLNQLLDYVDKGLYVRYLIPGQEYEFHLQPDLDKRKLH